MKKVLITGNLGYIGQALVNLLSKNHKIIGFDKNRCLTQDLTDKVGLEDFFKTNKNIDLVIHLAALAGVEKDSSEYQDYLDNNVQGTFNLLEAMREYKVKNLIFASSCSVYGNNDDCKETDELFPESFYGLSKVMCEEMIKFYGRKFNINYQILRIFNVIGRGPNSDFQKNRLIPKVLEKIKNNEPIDIYLQKDGKNSQVRDYVDIKNVCDVIHELVINPFTNKIFNVGSGNKYSVTDIPSICIGLGLINNCSYNFIPGRDGDCDYQKANVDKLKSLGLFKNTSVGKIIKDIIENNEN